MQLLILFPIETSTFQQINNFVTSHLFIHACTLTRSTETFATKKFDEYLTTTEYL